MKLLKRVFDYTTFFCVVFIIVIQVIKHQWIGAEGWAVVLVCMVIICLDKYEVKRWESTAKRLFHIITAVGDGDVYVSRTGEKSYKIQVFDKESHDKSEEHD